MFAGGLQRSVPLVEQHRQAAHLASTLDEIDRDIEAGERRRAGARTRLAALTEREREVALGVGSGWSNGEIAAELGMTVATVKGHVSRLLTKLQLNNRVQVALMVHDAGQV
ncbi:hypothetical protein KRM28CT15_16400 [Krasilnikovia sp. M28-CT-15]